MRISNNLSVHCRIDTLDSERNGGISFNISSHKEYKEEIIRIFDLFIDDPNANTNTIILSSLKKILKDLGENMFDEELKELLKSSNISWLKNFPLFMRKLFAYNWVSFYFIDYKEFLLEISNIKLFTNIKTKKPKILTKLCYYLII